MILKVWSTVAAVMLSAMAVFAPSPVFAQHGPGRHGPDSGAAYDTKTEATFKGTVAASNRVDPRCTG